MDEKKFEENSRKTILHMKFIEEIEYIFAGANFLFKMRTIELSK